MKYRCATLISFLTAFATGVVAFVLPMPEFYGFIDAAFILSALAFMILLILMISQRLTNQIEVNTRELRDSQPSESTSRERDNRRSSDERRLSA